MITYAEVSDSNDRPVARVTCSVITQAELPLLGKAYFSVKFPQQGRSHQEHKELVLPVVERALQGDARCTFTGREGDYFIVFIPAPLSKPRTKIELDAYRQSVLSDLMSLVAIGLKNVYPDRVESSSDVHGDKVAQGAASFWLDAPAQG